MKNTSRLLILGGGYVGSRLAEFSDGWQTHRRLSDEPRTVTFDLHNPESWRNLPESDTVVWTFPATPIDLVQQFYVSYLASVERILVYASTSCYRLSRQNELIDENAALDLSKERVQGEEWLLQQGATLLVLAGIYGPGREPVSWLKKGLIKTPQKMVNLIHVDDIVNITLRMAQEARNIREERFNLADGNPRTWCDIAQHYDIPITEQKKSVASKRISNAKIQNWLDDYKFKRLY